MIQRFDFFEDKNVECQCDLYPADNGQLILYSEYLSALSARDKLIDDMISALDGFVMENWCRKCYYLQDDNYKDCIRISCSVLQQRCLLDRAEAMRGGKG